VDALDECKDKEPVSAFLSVLAPSVGDIPNIKFFITRRPEFVDDPPVMPQDRLKLSVNMLNSTALEGKSGIDWTYSQSWPALATSTQTTPCSLKNL
jgi:hypothetical protein